MKSTSLLLLLVAACLSACASQKVTDVPSAAPVVADTVLDPTNQENVRNSSVVQTLSVGPTQDPTNPNIREDAHNIERVVEPESWNLHPNVPTAINMGPIVAVNDPNRQAEPMTPELVQKIQQTLFASVIGVAPKAQWNASKEKNMMTLKSIYCYFYIFLKITVHKNGF